MSRLEQEDLIATYRASQKLDTVLEMERAKLQQMQQRNMRKK